MTEYNPEEKVFVNGEYHTKGNIVKALKLQSEIKRRFIEARDVYNEDHISPEHKQRAMDMATTFQGVLDHAGVEYV